MLEKYTLHHNYRFSKNVHQFNYKGVVTLFSCPFMGTFFGKWKITTKVTFFSEHQTSFVAAI
jgi:hypothetical protein